MMTDFLNSCDDSSVLPRLWLAEDDHVLRELLAEIFQRSGKLDCQRQFANAEEVLSALRQESPEIILLDVNMGGMTGIEAIRPIKRLTPETKVFLMTTFFDGIAKARAREAGADGFFLKHVDWEVAIERMCEAAEPQLRLNALNRPKEICAA